MADLRNRGRCERVRGYRDMTRYYGATGIHQSNDPNRQRALHEWRCRRGRDPGDGVVSARSQSCRWRTKAKPLGPGEFAGGYRPNPNSIMRSFGSERKMLRDFKRALRRVWNNFMGLVDRWLCSPVCLSSFIGLNFGCKSHDQVAGGTRVLNS